MADWNEDRGGERRSFRDDALYDRERTGYGRAESYGRGHPHDDFHPEYVRWREEQMRMHDRDYHGWREERRRQYDDEYRRGRTGWTAGNHNISRGMPDQDTGIGVGGTYRPIRSGFGRGDDAPSGSLEPRGAIWGGRR